MEPVGNIESPLQEVLQQNTGLHTYRDHTIVLSGTSNSNLWYKFIFSNVNFERNCDNILNPLGLQLRDSVRLAILTLRTLAMPRFVMANGVQHGAA